MRSLRAQGAQKKSRDPQGCLKKALTKRDLAHIKIQYFRGGVLGLGVDSSVWLYKFNLEKEKILESLRENLFTLKDIHFRLGESNGQKKRKAGSSQSATASRG
jgi:hypothetical protein